MARRPEADQSSETTEATMTKVSDSCYSTGCSNSQSQRSGSSKSLHSNSGSSHSSGYGGHRPPPQTEDKFSAPSSTKFNRKKASTSEAMETTVEAVTEEASPPGTEKMDTSEFTSLVEESHQTQGLHAQPEGQVDEPDPGGTSQLMQQVAVAHALQVISKLHAPDPIGDIEMPGTVSAESAKEGPPPSGGVMQNILGDVSSGVSGSNGFSPSSEFCVVVSLHDGKVIYTSPTLTEVLGFPKDMWLGRSVVDFIHQKDKIAFASHITSGVAAPPVGAQFPLSKSPSKNTFFCCLRKHRGLRNAGFGVKNKQTEYLPCQLQLTFKAPTQDSPELCLIITARAVKSAYTVPDDTFRTPKFSTRQSADCIVSLVDSDAVGYLGYLPQDIVGRSIFDFYHPEDTPIIKEMYESVLEGVGNAGRSKPYRFRAQHGEWVILETEWSSFINPWSRKLEFVIGQHNVLKGPHNPDVFAPPRHPEPSFPDEVVSDLRRAKDGITFLLNDTFYGNPDAKKENVSQRCKDLAVFLKTLMDECTKPANDKPEETVLEEHSFSTMLSHERESVMLGEISPHHEAGSNPSTETPPSYSQLNYKENIARFFESKPKTALESDETTETTMKLNSESDNSGVGSGTRSGSGSGSGSGSNQKAGGSSNQKSDSGSGSSKKADSGNGGSNKKTDSSPGCSKKNEGNNKSKLCNAPLTRAILSRHNENMEKRMLQKHKELRAKDGKESRLRKTLQKHQEPSHGVKRCGSDSWEVEKVTKHQHVGVTEQERCAELTKTSQPCEPPILRDSNFTYVDTNIALWPRLPVAPSGCTIAAVIPVYCISSDSTAGAAQPGAVPTPSLSTEPGAQPRVAAPSYPSTIKPVPLLNAFAMFGASARSVPAPAPPPVSCKSENFQRPASQATSIKPEPGSTRGSAMMSEFSKKDKTTDQDEDSPNMSDGDKSKSMAGTGYESSYSSSFSTFNKTDESWKGSDPEHSSPAWGARPVKKEPPWLEDISVTPELVYRYQLGPRDLSNVLDADLAALRALSQPSLVDEQLEQLYIDLEKAGLSTKLKLELSSGSSSGNSSGEENRASPKEARRKKRHYDYGQLEMIYEENMPLPPPSVPIASVTS